MATPSSVRLYETRGATTILIDAEIKENGDLVLSGYDYGEAPEQTWGDSGYEYWVVLEAAHLGRLRHALLRIEFGLGWPLPAWLFNGLGLDDWDSDAIRGFLDAESIPYDDRTGAVADADKEHLTLALMRRCFGGEGSAVSLFVDFLKTQNIPYRFDTWV